MVVDGSKKGQAAGALSAVLCSGGLDSAVLVADERTRGEVQPVFVNAGFAWERREHAILDRFLSAPLFDIGVRPLVTLSCPVTDVYASSHWALTGHPPGYNTPGGDVYLVGRNVLLLSKVAVFCAVENIGRIVIGPLSGNPFSRRDARILRPPRAGRLDRARSPDRDRGAVRGDAKGTGDHAR